MQADDQRLTRKDAVFDNVKILNGNQIPLTNTLTGKLPLRGSLIALKSGNIHDLYYGDGLQWVPITDGGSTADPPLVEVLAAGNVTGGNDIEITSGDSIVSENGGVLNLRGTGFTSKILIDSQGTGSDAIDINSSGGVAISSSLNQEIAIDSDGLLILTSDSSNPSSIFISATNVAGGIDINAGNDTGRIDIDAGSGGISSNTSGQLLLASSQVATDAIRINATAGGIDVDSVQQLNLTSTQNADNAVRIQANGGGIDIDASTQVNIASGLPTILSNNKTLIGANTAAISTTQSVAPSVTASGVGGMETIVAGSTDTAGSVSWTPSTDGADIFIDFGVDKTTYAVMITPTNTPANLADLFVFAKANGTFTIRAATVGASLVTCDYLVIGYE